VTNDERWLGPVLRHGAEARLDGVANETRVMVYLDDGDRVQWGPVGGTPIADGDRHRFHFWVHGNTDAERLAAIQILGTKLEAAGHTYEVIPVPVGGQPEGVRRPEADGLRGEVPERASAYD
jgi:hypothetical protein